MYLPEAFRETRIHVLHDFIEAHPLGMLVSVGPEGPEAGPVPFVLDRSAGRSGVLRAHLARANPHWRAIAAAPDCLVMFGGPEAYVSPSWYATKRESGKVVPTWNYAMVSVRGRAMVIDDAAWLRAQVEALTGAQEAGRPEPWAVGDAPESFVATQLRGIVGIEIPIGAIEGKWKASQNRPEPDRRDVADGLAAEGAGDMARIVRARDPERTR